MKSSTRICHNCGRIMHCASFTDTFIIHSVPIRVPVTGYVCEACHETVYTSEQAKHIEQCIKHCISRRSDG